MEIGWKYRERRNGSPIFTLKNWTTSMSLIGCLASKYVSKCDLLDILAGYKIVQSRLFELLH